MHYSAIFFSCKYGKYADIKVSIQPVIIYFSYVSGINGNEKDCLFYQTAF